MSKTYTPRGFTLAIKKVLAARGIPATVKSETLSFSGFGYGSACSAEVRLEAALPEDVKPTLAGIEKEFRESGQGPEFSDKEKSAFKISLGGPAYPFGGKVS